MSLFTLKKTFNPTMEKLFEKFLEIYETGIYKQSPINSYKSIKNKDELENIFNIFKDNILSKINNNTINNNFEEIFDIVRGFEKNNIVPNIYIIYVKINKKIDKKIDNSYKNYIKKQIIEDIELFSQKYYDNKLNNSHIGRFIDRISYALSNNEISKTKIYIKNKMIQYNKQEMNNFHNNNENKKYNRSLELEEFLTGNDKIKGQELELNL